MNINLEFSYFNLRNIWNAFKSDDKGIPVQDIPEWFGPDTPPSGISNEEMDEDVDYRGGIKQPIEPL